MNHPTITGKWGRICVSPFVAYSGWVGARVQPLRQGYRYQGRVALVSLASWFGSSPDVAKSLRDNGFDQVQVWNRPQDLPAGWPAEQRAPHSEGDTYWLQGVWSRPNEDVDLDQLEQKQSGLRVLWISEGQAPTSAPPGARPPAPASAPPASAPPASAPPASAPPPEAPSAAPVLGALGVLVLLGLAMRGKR